MKMFGKKNKCDKKLLRKYPCDAFLKNALHFIEIGRPNVAYTEICRAIVKSGGQLSDEEFDRYFKIRSGEIKTEEKKDKISDTWKQQTMSRFERVE